MLFEPTPLQGAYVIGSEPIWDQRGFFERTWCRDEFESKGLNSKLAQCSISFNKLAGTLRGMHFQKPPHVEAKLVRCINGSIFDVIIDLRGGSPSFKQWFGINLTASNRSSLYVPEGLAHGFMSLENDTEVLYQISEQFNADHSDGVRWNDQAFGIRWPMDVRVISERDQFYSDFATSEVESDPSSHVSSVTPL